MSKSRLVAALALAMMFVESSIAVAQLTNTPSPLEPSDTSSVRATLHSFIDACNELYDLARSTDSSSDVTVRLLPAFERIRDCLDLSAVTGDLRDSMGVESAIFLKEVLDRIELPEYDAIPGFAAGEEELVVNWRVPGTRITIQRVEVGPQDQPFLFTAESVRRAATSYGVAKELPYRSEGPRTSPGLRERYLALTKRQPTLSEDTSSPRGTLTLFLDKAQDVFELTQSARYLDRSDPELVPLVSQVYGCLDLSELPEYTRDHYAGEAAVCLKEVLDRTALPSIEAIPGPENLQASDANEPLARWQIPSTRISIVRVTEGPQRGKYLFNTETVGGAVAMYESAKDQPYRSDGPPVSPGLHDWFLSVPSNATVGAFVEVLPRFFHQRKLGLAIWQMLGLTFAAAIGICAMLGLYRIGGNRSDVARQAGLWRYWLSFLFAVAALFVPLAFKRVIWEVFTIRGTPLYVANFTADVVFLLAVIIAILAASSRLADSMLALPRVRSREVDATLIRILFRVIGIVAASIVFLEGGRYLGFPLTTLLASAGIGGLAIALSAQGAVKGLFGTVTVLLDRPYRVGERIMAKGHDGVVEEIGLRSTKIREFLTNHLISVPNDQMADSDIVNIGKRQHIYRQCDLHIPIDTTRDKVEKAVAAIRTVLESQTGMDPEFPPQVFFNDFNHDSFNVRIIYWHVPPDLWSYYRNCEQINFEIFKAFEEQGIQFSLPARHSYWKTDDAQGPLEVHLAESSDHSRK